MYVQDVWIRTLLKLTGSEGHTCFMKSCFPSTFSPVKRPKQVFFERSTTLTMLLLKEKKKSDSLRTAPPPNPGEKMNK